MGCCGKTIKQVKHIATGFVNLARDIKYEFTDDRVRVCQKCKDNYWIGRILWCGLCKCSVPAAARVKDKHCPKGAWENGIESELTNVK